MAQGCQRLFSTHLVKSSQVSLRTITSTLISTNNVIPCGTLSYSKQKWLSRNIAFSTSLLQPFGRRGLATRMSVGRSTRGSHKMSKLVTDPLVADKIVDFVLNHLREIVPPKEKILFCETLPGE